MAKIEVRGLGKAFARNSVLSGLELTIEDGEFFCLVGPSGCGKTTLLNLIAGLEEASVGEIFFDGRPVGALGPRERDVAMVFQNYALYPHKTVRENIAFPLLVRGLPKDEIRSRVERMAELMGLSQALESRPAQLSGGQQQRVALGRALVRQPRVFLMDEPLSNLDAKLRAQMRMELKKLHQDFPVTTLYVTHDQEEAMSLSDRMVILKGGAPQQVGTPMEVYENPANLFVGQFIGKPPMNTLEAVVEGSGLRIGSQLWPLPDSMKAALPSRVTVGLRPEHILLEAYAGEGICGRLELIEPMGAETWAELSLGQERLLCRIQGKTGLALKSQVRLRFEPGAFYFFDAQGRRISRPAS